MKPVTTHIISFKALLAAAIVCSYLVTPVQAIEITTSGADKLDVYSSMRKILDNDMQAIHNEIATERTLRETIDNAISGELQDRIDLTTARIVALENRLPILSDKIENFNTVMTAEMTTLKNMVTELEKDMSREFAIRNNLITAINTEMDNHAADLQSQITANQARINDLYMQVANINIRITNLNNFLTDINNRLVAQRECIAAGTCVRQSAPSLSLYNDIQLFAGEEVFGSGIWGNTHPTGLSTSQYQYCSVSGNTGMGGRDFNVFPSNGIWYMGNEMDNWAWGDEKGTLFMNCMSIN